MGLQIRRLIYRTILFCIRFSQLYRLFKTNPGILRISGNPEPTDTSLCVFASYNPYGVVPKYVFYSLKAIRAEGFDIVYVTTADVLSEQDIAALSKTCRVVVHRKNTGYDFGSWKAGLLGSGVDLKKYRRLLLTNDSCYFPLFPLQATLRNLTADMNGITDSFEIKYHLMSYFILYDSTIFHSDEFTRLWRNVRMLPAKLKGLIIELYEVGMSQYYLKRGFKLAARFSAAEIHARFKSPLPLDTVNSVHRYWRELIEIGKAPVLKVDLFKRFFRQSNDVSWKSVVAKTKYPVKLIEEHQRLSKRSDRVASGDLHIHQIYFRKDQRALLDPNFIPYFKAEFEEPEWREYWTFLKNAPKAIRKKGLTGFLSWKFTAKSRISSEKFLNFVKSNPGYDVYYLNPFPLDAVLFDNVWHHGEFYHPGLIAMSHQILKHAGYNIDISRMQHGRINTAYSNYWIGNSKFWRKYMEFTRPLEQYIRHHLTAEEREFVYRIADPVSNCSHIPFIFERMFSSLLLIDPDIKFISYQYTDAELRRRYTAAIVFAYQMLTGNTPQWLRKTIQKLILTIRRLTALYSKIQARH